MGHRVRRAAEAYGDPFGVAHGLRGKLLDLRRARGREQHGLPLRGQLLQDGAHRGQEAHVEHAVGLIQHQHLHAAELGVTLFDVVEQAARAGDDDFDPVAQGFDLRPCRNTAVNGGAAELRFRAQIADGFMGLLRQFAGGADDERAEAAARPGEQLLQNGQHKGGRLAGAGLRGAEQIVAGEGGRQSRQLNGRGRDVADASDRRQ